jgi:Ni/Co efflux regulator RcnB
VHLSVNIGGLHANINSPRRYHYSGAWNRPSGWHAQRWAYGQRLPGGWYARDYWLNDYVSFGLVAPPDGYAWIREGDDAVLVDTNTGEIVRVEYNVFY